MIYFIFYFLKKGKCENGTRYVPIKIMDVAGLIPGASEGLVIVLYLENFYSFVNLSEYYLGSWK